MKRSGMKMAKVNTTFLMVFPLSRGKYAMIQKMTKQTRQRQEANRDRAKSTRQDEACRRRQGKAIDEARVLIPACRTFIKADGALMLHGSSLDVPGSWKTHTVRQSPHLFTSHSGNFCVQRSSGIFLMIWHAPDGHFHHSAFQGQWFGVIGP